MDCAVDLISKSSGLSVAPWVSCCCDSRCLHKRLTRDVRFVLNIQHWGCMGSSAASTVVGGRFHRGAKTNLEATGTFCPTHRHKIVFTSRRRYMGTPLPKGVCVYIYNNSSRCARTSALSRQAEHAGFAFTVRRTYSTEGATFSLGYPRFYNPKLSNRHLHSKLFIFAWYHSFSEA